MAGGIDEYGLTVANKIALKNYMVDAAPEHIDDCGEIDATGLAEDAAQHFDHDEWLDEETHPVWDFAAAISNHEPIGY